MQTPVRMHSFMPSDKKIQQDEDQRDKKFIHLLKEELLCFRKRQKEEILHSDLKRKHELPISRIRRAMKSNDQVKLVSSHSTVLLAKATEMFIHELTLRAWMQAEQEKRRTLKRCDIAKAIRNEELFDFLSDIVPLQNYKCKFQVQQEVNDGQGNVFHPAYQMAQPNNIPVQQEANDGQGNEFHQPHQLIQPNNILVQAVVNDGQGNEFHPIYQMGQPSYIPVQLEVNDGQGNEFHPAHQLVQPNTIPVQVKANDGQGNEPPPTYQMGQPNSIPLEEEANGGQGNEYHLVSQMVQPNNVPASSISIQGIPAPLVEPPLIDLSPEDEFFIDGLIVDNIEGL